MIMTKMKASVSWMYIKPYRSQLPQVKIIEGEEEIVKYITRLHLYADTIYILVEFNGIIYDVSKPDGIHTQELIRAMIESKYDEKYTIVYENIGDNKIRFIDNLDTYQLLFKLINDFNTVGEDLLFVEYEGYIYDCTDINRLRQVKQYLVKEYAKELKYEF